MNLSEELHQSSLSEQAEPLTEEMKMIGFRASGRSIPRVLARVNACTKYQEGGSKPEIQVWLSPAGKKSRDMKKIVAALKKGIPGVMKATKGNEYKKGAGPDQVCYGLAEIGDYSVQNSYSDDSYYAVRAERDALGKAIIEIIKKAVGTSGGHVGSGSYRGSGAISGGNGDYTYHYHSFGIGD